MQTLRRYATPERESTGRVPSVWGPCGAGVGRGSSPSASKRRCRSASSSSWSAGPRTLLLGAMAATHAKVKRRREKQRTPRTQETFRVIHYAPRPHVPPRARRRRLVGTRVPGPAGWHVQRLQRCSGRRLLTYDTRGRGKTAECEARSGRPGAALCVSSRVRVFPARFLGAQKGNPRLLSLCALTLPSASPVERGGR